MAGKKHDLNKINYALWEAHMNNSLKAMGKYPPFGLKGKKPVKRHAQIEEVKSLTLSLLFTPELVHHIPVRIDQPEGLHEIRVVCPNCTNTMDYPMRIQANSDRMESVGYADMPIVVLRDYQFTQRDYDVDCTNHGWVWVNKCHKCNHILYASKWKTETATERMMYNMVGAEGA